MSWLLFARLSSVHVKVSAHNDFMMVMRGNQSGELPASAWAPVAQPLTYQGDLWPVSGSPSQLPVACLMLGSQPECNHSLPGWPAHPTSGTSGPGPWPNLWPARLASGLLANMRVSWPPEAGRPPPTVRWSQL